MPDPIVSHNLNGPVGTIIMDDPATRNSLSTELIQAMTAAIDELHNEARVLVLRARPGVRTWSSGHSVKELPTHGRDPLAYGDPLRTLIRRIRDCSRPVVAMVEGGVWGGACEVVMTCDVRIVAKNTTFALTPAKLGVPYNMAGVLNMMGAANPTLVREMLYRARPIDAEKALARGLVNEVVPNEELEALTMQEANEIATNSPMVLALLKEQLKVLSEASPLTPETFERVQGMRRAIYDSEDYQEGLRSFFEKRPPQFHDR